MLANGGKGHEFRQAKLLKGEYDDSLCGLRGITQAPVMFGQAPTDFYAGENGRSSDGTCKPTKPMNWFDARSSTAQKPQPRVSISRMTR